MRLATLASLLTAGLVWFALSGVPAPSRAEDAEAPTCATCGKSSSTCPHCAGDTSCPHCGKAKSCPHCPHRGHHGKWSGHTWEYKCVRPSKKLEAMNEQFNALGAEGWRLAKADGGVWCFGRIKRAP